MLLRFVLVLCLLMGFGMAQDDLEYPESSLIEGLANIYHPVPFSHDRHMHLNDGPDACIYCHHTAEEDVYMACGECHDAQSEDMGTLNAAYHRICLDCHTEWSDGSTCASCHIRRTPGIDFSAALDQARKTWHSKREINLPGVFLLETPDVDETVVTFHHRQHADDFQIDCASCHKHTDCEACHGSLAGADPIKTHFEEPHESCMDCHAEAIDDNCEKCHQAEPSNGFSHNMTGFILKPYHADNACTACHPAGQPVQALDRSCTNCHSNFEVGEFNHDKTGFALSESHIEIDCYDCHQDDYSKAPVCTECHDEDVFFPDMEPGEYLD